MNLPKYRPERQNFEKLFSLHKLLSEMHCNSSNLSPIDFSSPSYQYQHPGQDIWEAAANLKQQKAITNNKQLTPKRIPGEGPLQTPPALQASERSTNDGLSKKIRSSARIKMKQKLRKNVLNSWSRQERALNTIRSKDISIPTSRWSNRPRRKNSKFNKSWITYDRYSPLISFLFALSKNYNNGLVDLYLLLFLHQRRDGGIIILSNFTMTIELARQSSIDTIIAAVKEFKRTGERIVEITAQGKSLQALTLLQQEERNLEKIEQMLRQCEEGYLNPEVAKRLMIARNQFKEERDKLAKRFHAANVKESQTIAEAREEAVAEEGFDYELQNRLLKEKEESLSQVHLKITNIHSIMQETQEMTDKQGEQLDIMDQNLVKTKENVVQSNKHLTQADKLSAGHNRCYIWLAIIVLTVLCMMMLVFLLDCFISVLQSIQFRSRPI